jgi:hypothetical protein
VIFTAYFDEADTHGPAPTIIMAAYVGRASQWRRFERRIAKLQKRYGFSIFHGKDFRARAGEFSGSPDAKCDALVSDLMEATRRLERGVAIALSRDRYLNEYRAPPIPKKFNLDSQYGACFRGCLGYLLPFMDNKGGKDKLNVVIEHGHPNAGNCLSIFEDIKRRDLT